MTLFLFFFVGFLVGVMLGHAIFSHRKAGRLIFTKSDSDEAYMLVELENADVLRNCNRIYLDVDDPARK